MTAFPCKNLWMPARPAGDPVRARCGQCETCQELRRYRWKLRAGTEQGRHKRTWFATCTFGPQARRAIFSAASMAEKNKPSGARLIRASGRYVTLMLKRARARGVSLRYLFVAEEHKDGFPHWHGLIHTWQLGELAEEPDWDYQQISACWPFGWMTLDSVTDIRAAGYVTKYITKAPVAKIRASRLYGADAI